MLDSNRKGAIAEAKVVAAATELGIPVLKPMAEHGRYDLAFEIAHQILRVQCKWGSCDAGGAVINVNLESSFLTPHGYVRRGYTADEIDLFAIYCGELDRCYLLPIEKLDGRRAICLRLSSPKNSQRGCINLAASVEFPGAVAQLEERLNGIQEAGGSSPPSSTPTAVPVGCHEFRNHFGFYLERAASGETIEISRRGRPYARLIAAPASERGPPVH